MKPVLDVVAGIVWRDGEYLAVERPEGARMAGWWEFPGGKIEPGETPDNALVREFQEELGVTPTEFEYWRDLEHEYEEFVVRLNFFHIRNYSGELQCLGKSADGLDRSPKGTHAEFPARRYRYCRSPPSVIFSYCDLDITVFLH